jgi:hypothetical protein
VPSSIKAHDRLFGERTSMVNAGLATATIERMVVGGRPVKVVRMRITATGRRALSKLRWP